jgi:hypothetical protein
MGGGRRIHFVRLRAEPFGRRPGFPVEEECRRGPVVGEHDGTNGLEALCVAPAIASAASGNVSFANANDGGSAANIVVCQAQLLDGNFPDGGPIIRTVGAAVERERKQPFGGDAQWRLFREVHIR